MVELPQKKRTYNIRMYVRVAVLHVNILSHKLAVQSFVHQLLTLHVHWCFQGIMSIGGVWRLIFFCTHAQLS